MYYRIIKSDEYIEHKGIVGMRWGYTLGKRNGKRTAKEVQEDEYKKYEAAQNAGDYFVGRWNKYNRKSLNSEQSTEKSKYQDIAERSAQKASKYYNEADKHESAAKHLSDLSARIAFKAGQKVAELQEKAKKQIDNAKKWLTSLLWD